MSEFGVRSHPVLSHRYGPRPARRTRAVVEAPPLLRGDTGNGGAVETAPQREVEVDALRKKAAGRAAEAEKPSIERLKEVAAKD